MLPPRTKKAIVTLATVALVLPVTFSLLIPYMPNGHDTLQYLIRQVEFHQNISQGVLFPQWAPDLSHGAGEPLFEFNPPMIYYLAEFWHLLGFEFVTAINLACVVLVLASAVGMYLLGRLYFGSWGGWLAATAYLYAPYFSVILYVRGALAEFAAFPFYALALFGFGAYAQYRKRGYLLLGTLAYAGVILSHNAAALFFTPLLLAFFLLTVYMAGRWDALANQLLGWLLGLGLGACVWIPSLAERKYVQLDRLLLGFYRYSNYFVHPHRFIESRWGFGLPVAGDESYMSLSLGWSHLVLVLLMLAAAVKYRNLANWRWNSFFSAATLLFCFMMTPYAAPIWDRVSLLQYVAFPWRMLGPASACLALLIAPLGPFLRALPRWRYAALAVALALLILPNFFHNRPRNYRLETTPKWAPTQLAAHGLEATTTFEYVPRWVRQMAAYNPQGFQIVAGDAQMQLTARTATSWTGDVRATGPVTADLSIAWFPGWMVLLDNQPANASPADPTGLIRIEIPPGNHHIVASLKRTPSRSLGQALSLLSLLAIALLFVSEFRRRSQRGKTTSDHDLLPTR